MKRLVFDFDGTLYGEGDKNYWLELYSILKEKGAKKIWLFSNGTKWLKKQIDSEIAFEHIDDVPRFAEDLELVDKCIEHARSSGYQGMMENAALVKRNPAGSILVDDLAATWVAIGNSCPSHTMTPETFIEKVVNGYLRLMIDDNGYLSVAD